MHPPLPAAPLPPGYEALPPHLLPTALQLAAKLHDLLPGLEHRRSFGGAFFYYMNRYLLYVGVTKQRDGLYLGFTQGASLHDPDGLLQGTGRQVRQLPFPGLDLSVLDTPAFAGLLDAAVARNAEIDAAQRQRKPPSARRADRRGPV